MQIIDTVDSAMLSSTLICSEDTASSTPSLAQRDNPLALCVLALRDPGQRDTAHPDRCRMGGGSLRCTVGALTTSESPLETQAAHSCAPSRSSSGSQAFTSGISAANCPARRTRAWKVRTRRPRSARSSGVTPSSSRPTLSSRQRRLFSCGRATRATAADRFGLRVHRREQGPLRGRSDLPRAFRARCADRPAHVLRLGQAGPSKRALWDATITEILAGYGEPPATTVGASRSRCMGR
jgi:hypothetical protein